MLYHVRVARRKNSRARRIARQWIGYTWRTAALLAVIGILAGPVTWYPPVFGTSKPVLRARSSTTSILVPPVGLQVATAHAQEAPKASDIEKKQAKYPRTFNCLASWYSESDPGIRPLMANGKPFDDGQLIVAMRGVAPYGTRVRITAHETGAIIYATIADWGPAKSLSERCVDLTRATWEATGKPKSAGLQHVTVDIIVAK